MPVTMFPSCSHYNTVNSFSLLQKRNFSMYVVIQRRTLLLIDQFYILLNTANHNNA